MWEQQWAVNRKLFFFPNKAEGTLGQILSAVKKPIVCCYVCTTAGVRTFKSQWCPFGSVLIDLSQTSVWQARIHFFTLRLSIWSSDAWDSSVRWVRHQSPPSLKGAMRHQMALVERCPCLLSFPTLKATDTGKMSKAAPRRISSTFSCLPSWVTVWLWLQAVTGLVPDRPLFFFRTLGTAFCCIYLHSCQTVWTQSWWVHTPVQLSVRMCVVFVPVRFVPRSSHWGRNIWYLAHSSCGSETIALYGNKVFHCHIDEAVCQSTHIT